MRTEEISYKVKRGEATVVTCGLLNCAKSQLTNFSAE